MSFKLTVNTPAFVPDWLLGFDMEELELKSLQLNELEAIACLQKELSLLVDPEFAGSKRKARRLTEQRSSALDHTRALIKETRAECQSLVNSIKKRSAERAHERARIKRHFC